MRISYRPVLLLAVALAGCTKTDPLYCDEATPCGDSERPFCDLEGEYAESEGIKRTCIADPDFSIALADEDAQVRIGSELQLEVTVDRKASFPADVTITASGLPPGTSAEPITIDADSTSGTLAIQGGDAEPGALMEGTVVATSGPLERTADLRLLVLGPAGTLDPTFGTNGFVGEPVGSDMDDAIALMPLDDGSIIVGGPNRSPSDEAVLVRYSSDGELDTAFGEGGSTQVAFDGADIDANASVRFAQQSDGKIIVGTGSETGDMALARVTTDGDLDSTFVGGGIAVFPIAGGPSIQIDTIGIGPDNEIVVAMAHDSGDELSVVRFDRDGEKDLSFAGGRLALDRGSNQAVSRVQVFADGGMLVSGSAYEPDPPAVPFYVRLTASGSLDSSVGEGGEISVPAGFGLALVEDTGAMLLLDVADANVAFRRMTPAGEPDSSFGDGGELMVAVPAGWTGGSYLPTAAGLLAVGRPDITLTRFDLDLRELDPTFGDGGTATTLVENIAARRAVRQADGRVVVLADEDSFPFLLARFFE